MRRSFDRWTWIAIALAVAAGAIALASHEMWRDEWQAWLIAERSESVGQLLRNVRSEGHSPFWHLILYLLSRVGSVELMRLFSAAIGVVAIGIVAVWGPFRTWQKPLFALGYFVTFEYLAISRPYGLTALLVFAYVALRCHSGWRSNPWPSLVVLVLLALTSVYGAMLSMALAGAPLLKARRPSRDEIAAAVVAVVSVVAFVLLARPSAGVTGAYSSDVLADPFLRWDPDRLSDQLQSLWTALVPIPPLRTDGWWLGSLIDFPGRRMVMVAAAGSACLFGLIFRRSLRTALAWFVAVVGFVVFGYVMYEGDPYHYGHLYLFVIALAWMAVQRGRIRLDQRVLTAVLALHAIAGVAAVSLDGFTEFSNGERVAHHVDGDDLVAVDPDWIGTTIAGELGRDVFMVASNRRGSFVRWDMTRTCEREAAPLCLSLDEVLARVEDQDVDLLALPPTVRVPPDSGWTLEKRVLGSASGEDVVLYRRDPR